MTKYLLEIGTEELPYRFIPQAMAQLKSGFENFFESNKIDFDKVEIFATPRRLAVIVNGLAEKQPDEEKVLKGPIKKVAYDENGNLTQAGKGFLQKNNVDAKDAFIENDYLHAKVFNKGKLTSDALQENVAQIVLKLQGPYFMRWAGFDEKFSRPIRWVVSILDNKEVPVQIVDVKSSRFSRGHRFSNGNRINTENNIEINNPDEYIDKLKKAYVYVNQDERKSEIIRLSNIEAEKLGLSAYATHYKDEDLLNEVTYLCEWPVPVVCDFDKKYLDIPEKVIVTVTTKHQRYFPLFKNGKLTNKFITITNYLGDDFSNIKAGNERVVTARLEDAIFFFKEDTKKPLTDYIENLKGVTFQKNLGSVYQKMERILGLSEIIAKEIGCTEQQIENIKQTAELCKADLVTKLVFEFPELQGFIGSDYSRVEHNGKRIVNESVSLGIMEHYYPLNAESEVAFCKEGQVVGIADKLDTICAVFANGKKPTGSSDPLGVRRAALGIIKTIIEKNLLLNLSDLIKFVVNSFNFKELNKESIISEVEEFFVQRLIIFLADNYKKDVLEACSKNKNALENLCDFVVRVKFLSDIIKKPEFSSINESANRISRILKEEITTSVNPNLFVADAEKNLFVKINEIKETDYETLFNGLKEANPAIEKFFEDVLVMDKDEKIKQNRLAMLTMLKEKYELIADFSALQI